MSPEIGVQTQETKKKSVSNRRKVTIPQNVRVADEFALVMRQNKFSQLQREKIHNDVVAANSFHARAAPKKEDAGGKD